MAYYQFASFARAASTEGHDAQPIDPFLTRLLSVSPLTAAQAEIVAAMQGPPLSLHAREQLGLVGDSARSAYVIREGWAFAYTLLANGERQVLGFLLPGDIVGLSALFRDRAERGIETITETVVSEISMESVRRASRQWPEIFELFLRLQSGIQSALVEQLVDLGRRDSRARVAQLLLKLERRLMSIGRAGPDGYYFPVSQYLIADAVGLTAIHVNRVLRGLREEESVTVRRDRVTIHDRSRLMMIAGEGEEADGGAEIVAMNGSRHASEFSGNHRSRSSL